MMSLIHKLRTLFFSPNSQLELWLRTAYHKLAATRLAFQFQDWIAKRSYTQWREVQNMRAIEEPDDHSYQPKVTFILSTSSDVIEDTHHTLKSILRLQSKHWEVVLTSKDQKDPVSFPSTLPQDPRIKIHTGLLEIPSDLITGEYILFCIAGDVFFENLLTEFYQHLKNCPETDLVYFDCEFRNKKGKTQPFFKPKALSPAQFLSVNIFSRSILNRTTVEKYWHEMLMDRELWVKEYELALILYENKVNISHIPSVLVSQTSLIETNQPETQRVIVRHLKRLGYQDLTIIKKSYGTQFMWKTGSPSTAIIIPTKNHHQYLKPLLESIYEKTKQSNYSIHIVDNGSTNPATLAYYQRIKEDNKISIIPYNKPFNYSEAINLGVEHSSSDLVLLMNDDMKIKDTNWLSELTQWACRPDVGVVGTKLLRLNNKIQHAGIILGLSKFMGHIYLNAPDHYCGLLGCVDWYRNYLALTGALQMLRREVFEEANGYDEGYRLAFGDIDFCVRVHELGYQNVYTPFAAIYHYEGSSRGYTTPVEDILRGYDKMEKYLIEHDPYFSPNLTYTRIPRCRLEPDTQEMRLNQIEERRSFYTRPKTTRNESN